MSVAKRLKKYMEANGYSKADLSRMSSIPYTTIDGLFKKGDENVKLSTLKKLAGIIGCTLDELVYSEEELARGNAVFAKEEIQVIKKYRQLDADGKADINDLIDSKLARAERAAKEQEEGLA